MGPLKRTGNAMGLGSFWIGPLRQQQLEHKSKKQDNDIYPQP